MTNFKKFMIRIDDNTTPEEVMKLYTTKVLNAFSCSLAEIREIIKACKSMILKHSSILLNENIVPIADEITVNYKDYIETIVEDIKLLYEETYKYLREKYPHFRVFADCYIITVLMDILTNLILQVAEDIDNATISFLSEFERKSQNK